jgi:hypothetical protein
MDDDITTELTRLRAYATASGQDFEHVAAEAVVRYQRSLRAERQAREDIDNFSHFQRFPRAVA